MSRFEAGELDRVQLVYTRFISLVTRGPSSSLPPVRGPRRPSRREGAAHGPTADYEFEPDPDAILETLLPRYTESRLYTALLDAAASSTPPASAP